MTLLLTFLPGLLILFYFVYSDRFKEPKKIILITFILGMVIGYPAGYLNHYVARFFSNGNIINDALVGGAFAGGTDAGLAWFICTDPKTTKDEIEKQKNLLIDYCAKDTLAVYYFIKFIFEKIMARKPGLYANIHRKKN